MVGGKEGVEGGWVLWEGRRVWWEGLSQASFYRSRGHESQHLIWIAYCLSSV